MDSGLTDGGWQAALELAFEERAGKTCLALNRHVGPLRVQKPLYPEGVELCHVTLLHPPGGIAGGDRLAVNALLGAGSQVLITTPGATKYYRSSGSLASQSVSLNVGSGARLEWMPQESIVYSGAIARQNLEVELGEGAVFICHECICLGRRESGETFLEGIFSQRITLRRKGKLLWRDALELDSASGVLASPAGLGGKNVLGTMVLADPKASNEWLTAVREVLTAEESLNAATLLPGVLVVRHLGDSTEKARLIFDDVWKILRPLALNRQAQTPRIWAT